MSISRICVREVDLAEPDETVRLAAQRMNARNVGTLMVLDTESRPVGIVTDRDLAIRVVGGGLDAEATKVYEVMSKSPGCVREDCPIEMALIEMRAGPFRRLPVVDEDGRLVGLISLDDIIDLLSEEFNEIGKLVRREGPRSLAEA